MGGATPLAESGPEQKVGLGGGELQSLAEKLPQATWQERALA